MCSNIIDLWSSYVLLFTLSQIFESYIPRSQDLENDKERLSYLEDIVNDAGLIANTCELLYLPSNDGDFDEVIGKSSQVYFFTVIYTAAQNLSFEVMIGNELENDSFCFCCQYLHSEVLV